MRTVDSRRISFRAQSVDGIASGLVLFDGVCVLCSGWVQFIFARDAREEFRFVSIQSSVGFAIARQLGIDPNDPATNVVVLDDVAYFKSDSALAVLSRLPWWRWTQVLTLVPRPIRDWMYDRVARNRYRWFGRTEVCLVPSEAQRSRFIDL